MKIKLLTILFSITLGHLMATSTSHNEMNVLVVGAGPSGLSVAKALQNRGIYPDIIEKREEISSDGAGIAIPANGSWALDKLGIDIASKALHIRKMQFTDDRGELLVWENIEKIHPNGSQFYSLTRNELMQQLLLSLHNQTLIQKTVTIKQFSEENDQVRVEFSDGKVKSYDFVIGCDGVHSSLRQQAHPNEKPEFLNLLVWRTVVDAPQDLEMPTYMLGADRGALLYPLPEGKAYVYGQMFQSAMSPPESSFSHLFSSFGGLVPQVLSSLDNARFYIHHMEKSHSVRYKLDGFKRVLLVGDAAHAFGPMFQNGAAQAFEDAYVLQELLGDTATKEEIPNLIDSFEKRRSERIQLIFKISNMKIQALSDPKQIQGRNDAIRKSGAPNVQGFKLIMSTNP